MSYRGQLSRAKKWKCGLKLRRNIARVVGAISIAHSMTGGAVAQSQFPLLFKSAMELKEIGLFISLEPDLTQKSLHFSNRCYYYGDGGYDLSISDRLLEHYKSQGFSHRSACMALVSGIKINPENGKRLATYVVAGSHELPISLPLCFNRALPYTDCAWRFDPTNGRGYSEIQIGQFKELGDKISTFLESPETRRAFYYLEGGPYTKGMIMLGAAQLIPQRVTGPRVDVLPSGSTVGRDVASWASFYDYADEFPKGFGYAVYAGGEAGSAISPEVIKAIANGVQDRPQVDLSKLKELWMTGSN